MPVHPWPHHEPLAVHHGGDRARLGQLHRRPRRGRRTRKERRPRRRACRLLRRPDVQHARGPWALLHHQDGHHVPSALRAALQRKHLGLVRVPVRGAALQHRRRRPVRLPGDAAVGLLPGRPVLCCDAHEPHGGVQLNAGVKQRPRGRSGGGLGTGGLGCRARALLRCCFAAVCSSSCVLLWKVSTRTSAARGSPSGAMWARMGTGCIRVSANSRRIPATRPLAST
mmetsp:Transcript_28100/g.66709  ORF Transcript_28100/g.66709 Transcript_28100/m.66709 type:complete len:226 (-) Transcript_28100:182-859(-)